MNETSPMWIDAHNHLQSDRLGNPAEIICSMKEAGVMKCVVNATREEDWTAVTTLAENHSDFILPAYGIHPWYAHTAMPGWEDRLRHLLSENPRSSIGECGLDQWIDHPSIEQQLPVFHRHLEIARELDRPVTIHCLKAWDVLFDSFLIHPPPDRFLMHSFGGSIEVARRLIPLGAYFSFSGYFLHPRKSKTLGMYHQLPLDRILVETDAPDMLPPPDIVSHSLPQEMNHPANLPNIAKALASSLGLSSDQLARQTGSNFLSCFG